MKFFFTVSCIAMETSKIKYVKFFSRFYLVSRNPVTLSYCMSNSFHIIIIVCRIHFTLPLCTSNSFHIIIYALETLSVKKLFTAKHIGRWHKMTRLPMNVDHVLKECNGQFNVICMSRQLQTELLEWVLVWLILFDLATKPQLPVTLRIYVASEQNLLSACLIISCIF